MKNFVVLYHAPDDLMEQSQNTPPEEQEEGMKAWMEWAEKCGDHLVDLGKPLTNGRRLMQGGKNMDSEKNVVGYSILQAADMNEAIQLLQGHPHMEWSDRCAIEVHETMPLPGM